MQEIVLVFAGIGYANKYQAKIKVFDLENNKVYEGSTYDGKVKVCLKTNCGYRLAAYAKSGNINCNFFVTSDCFKYYFAFRNSLVSDGNNTGGNDGVTFLLTDYNYENLPIERGSILLWQK